jgi:hypothetical protein
MLHRSEVAIVIGIIVLIFGILVWFKRLPSADGFSALVAVFNQRGGIIGILWLTSMIFFGAGIRLIYWAVNMQLDGKLTVDNALVVACFSWISGSAFGGAFGALLKTMTGEEPAPPSTTATPLIKQ